MDNRPQTSDGKDLDFLAGDGEMAALVRSRDWSRTSLGPIEDWPQSLRTTVSLCLASNFPINIIWGPDHVQIYNDGYRVVCGEGHPSILGMDYAVSWASAWPAIGEPFERALAGQTSFLENRRMFLQRNGYLEETFFTFSLSPIRDELGGIGGLFHPVTETTASMLGERRTRVVRDLTARLTAAKSETEVFDLAAGTLQAFAFDLPFVLFYQLEQRAGEPAQYRLAARTGIAAGATASPRELALDAAAPWPLAAAIAARATTTVENVAGLFDGIACGPYEEPPNCALVMPIGAPALEFPAAILIAGVSSRLPFDEAYKGFYDLLAAAIGAGLANAQAYEAERRRVEALTAIDRAKTAFFSNVSHEFRTPLTLMLGPVEDALAEPDLPERLRRRLEVARRNALRLLKLVNSLLDFARIEAGRANISFEPTDLARFTAELASNFGSACERAGLSLVVDCPPLDEPVLVDRDMWEKIVLNLVSNAFKFTLKGGVTVALRRVGDTVELTVRDTGVGVPASDLARIFERFHRIENQQGRTHEGSGIGLALVDELVQLHHGQITASSAEGQGSEFRVVLPLGATHLPQDRIQAERALAATSIGADAYVEEALRWLPEPGAATGRGAETTDVGRIAGAPRVLLADDNADMRGYVANILQQGGYDLEVASDGAAALAAIRRGPPPDLVLTDVMMPGLDGFGLLRALRADPALSGVLVVLLSARAGEEARVEGLEAGADDYLVKPFSARELRARIDGAIALSRARREASERESDLQAEIAVERGRAAALREADRRKDDFLSMLAHELRNPLGPISNAVHILGRLQRPEPSFQTAREMIERQVRHLAHLVDDLLDTTRIAQGKIQLQIERTDLARIARSTAEDRRSSIEARGLSLFIDVPSGPVWVNGDPVRLAQMLGNLLDNAQKFTRPGGIVALKLTTEQETGGAAQAVMALRDTGIGIAEDVLPHVFDVFSQADTSLSRNEGGLGLGLAVVKGLAEQQGGAVEAESAGLGCGAEFRVRLLLAEPVAGPVEPPAEATPGETDGVHPVALDGRTRVLVIEDNVMAALSLSMMLEMEGHLVEVAHTGENGLEVAHSFHPQAVVCDIGLPRMSGYDVARALRSDEETAGVHLVAVTGYGSEKDRQDARDAGFEEHMTKPLNPERLFAWLNEVTHEQRH